MSLAVIYRLKCFEIFYIIGIQGRRENSQGPGQNYIWGPYDIIFKQQAKNRWAVSRALRILLSEAFNTLQAPDFHGTLLNFGLILKLEGP